MNSPSGPAGPGGCRRGHHRAPCAGTMTARMPFGKRDARASRTRMRWIRRKCACLETGPGMVSVHWPRTSYVAHDFERARDQHDGVRVQIQFCAPVRGTPPTAHRTRLTTDESVIRRRIGNLPRHHDRTSGDADFVFKPNMRRRRSSIPAPPSVAFSASIRASSTAATVGTTAMPRRLAEMGTAA